VPPIPKIKFGSDSREILCEEGLVGTGDSIRYYQDSSYNLRSLGQK
jgi:hypothetical protein